MEKKKLTITLKELRQKKDLTQEQIANLLFISRSAYNKKENNKNSFKIEDLQKLIEPLGLSDKDILAFFNYNDSSTQNEMLEVHEKVIKTYKGILSFVFNMLYFEYELFQEVNFQPFHEASFEVKEKLSIEYGIEITEEIYNEKMREECDQFLEEEQYGFFCNFLYDHPFAIKILEFGLLGDEFQYFFERWQREYQLKTEQSHNPFYNVVISVNQNKELQDEMENFNRIINSEKFNIDYTPYSNSIYRS